MRRRERVIEGREGEGPKLLLNLGALERHTAAWQIVNLARFHYSS